MIKLELNKQERQFVSKTSEEYIKRMPIVFYSHTSGIYTESNAELSWRLKMKDEWPSL